jgi:PEGA domain
MKTFYIFVTFIALSTSAHAQTIRHLLVVIQPPSDRLLTGLTRAVSHRADDIYLDMYVPAGQSTEVPPHIADGLSKGKEAYEFLKFDESTNALNQVVRDLQAHLNSDGSLTMLKEAYLYLAMDYLAVDRETDAQRMIDEYFCVSGTSTLDPDTWPPNLIHLIERQADQSAGNAITISITTIPPGAELSVDGNKSGISPLQITLPQCTHYLRIRKPAYLTKSTPLPVAPDTASINFDLSLDPLVLSDTPGDRVHIKDTLARYKADGILILSGSAIQTTIQPGTLPVALIKATFMQQDEYIPASITFAYNNDIQSSDEILRLIRHGPKERLHDDELLKPESNKPPENRRAGHASWYKNKWLWAAGAAAIAGGIIFGIQDNHKSSSNTGSIAVKW